MKKALIIVGVIVVIGVFVVLNLTREGSRVEVVVGKVERRDVVKFVTASGRIRPKRQVNVSASAMGKITKLAIKEGDRVEVGDFLLQIDPTSYESVVDQLKASIRAAEATLAMEQANLRKAEYDLQQAERLHDQNVVSEEELRDARTNVQVARARASSAKESLAQHEANLKKARHDLEEVRITAGMTGVITALNVEEGENAIVGTMNNPGTVLLTIADLSEIEAEVEVDETEIVLVRTGQEAEVTLDAYPDSTFRGIVTEVGNSAIRSQLGLGQTSVDFKVVVALQDVIPNVRPGLSASARIRVAEAKDVLSIPIEALTIRRPDELTSPGDAGTAAGGDEEEQEEIEGVFVIENGQAQYRPVVVGIAGTRHFHVKEGLEEGEEVVTGPFKAVNELKNGDPVKPSARTDG